MRRKLPVLLLALIILLQVFVPAVYAASKNEAISSTLSFCSLDTTPEGTGKGFNINVKPNVSNQKLQNIVDDLYKGQGGKNTIGNGTAMDAVRNEIKTGLPTNGKFHSIKAQETINRLQRRLRAGDLTPAETNIANELIKDLQNALGGK